MRHRQSHKEQYRYLVLVHELTELEAITRYDTRNSYVYILFIHAPKATNHQDTPWVDGSRTRVVATTLAATARFLVCLCSLACPTLLCFRLPRYVCV